ncbi:hypothetical protein [Methanobrevibacter cuticularis]|uniref:hypothetical protein n=1 Tax=Methanobrevibacter cuticularis TaxID=47311 RepID=UPI001471A647|nr:hypothetical protein [Methanobrevibacter cuticularis]
MQEKSLVKCLNEEAKRGLILQKKKRKQYQELKIVMKVVIIILKKKMNITSFECIIYTHGLIDTLRIIYNII